MNGKIKTKFAALFAVALMITVCVVPMVGNDYGEAETVIVPSDGYEVAEVTISGTVKDAANPANGGLKNVKVIISGGIEDVETYTAEGGSYTGTVKLSKKSEGRTTSTITVTLDVTSDKVKPGAAEITNPAKGLFDGNNVAIIEDVASSLYSNIDFIAGNVLVTGSVSYENKVPYKGNDNISLYQVVDTVYVKKYTTAMNEGAYAFSVPANSGKYYVGYGEETVNSNKVTGVQYKSDEIDVSTVNKTANLVLVGLNVFTFKADAKSAGIPGQTTVTFTATDATLKTETVTINTDSEIEQLVEYVLAEGKTAATITATDSNKYGGQKSVSNKVLDYKFDNVIAGTVVLMNADDAANSTPIANNKVSLVNAGGVELLNDTTDSEGKFAIWTKGAALDGCELKTTYGNKTAVVEQETTGESIELEIVDDSYVNVSGMVVSELKDGTENIELEDVEVSIAYGSTTLVVKTDGSGSYNAYVPKSESVKISADTDYNYNVASYEFYAEKDTGNLNFIMDSKEITIKVQDDETSEPIKGASVFYSLDYEVDTSSGEPVVTATWSSALTTNNEGKVKFKVDQAADVHVYVSFEGRTFGATINEAADVNVSEYTISTIDTKYEFTFMNNEVPSKLVDVTGFTLPMVMKGDKKQIDDGKLSPTIYAEVYDWQEFCSLIIGNDKTSAYFYAVKYDSTTMASVEPYAYYLYDADGMIGEYYIQKIISDNIGTITLSKYKATGYVEDATNNPIAGATVTLMNAKDEVIGSGVTNSVGYYEFKTTESVSGAKVEIKNAGIFTFNDSLSYTDGTFEAKEGIYNGEIADAKGDPIYNADITVTSKATADGQTYTSKVDANGGFKYIGIEASGDVSTMLSAVDADGVYTFEAYKTVKIYGLYKADQSTVIFTIAQNNGQPAVGISVDVYERSATKGDVLVKSGLVSGEDGKVKLIVKSGKTYVAVAKSVENGLQFSDVPSIDPIKANNSYIDLTLKSANAKVCDDAEYVVSSYNVSSAGETKIGEATSEDGKVKLVTVNGAKYKVSSPEGALYTFGNETNKYYISESGGILEANESVYSGSVSDAMGMHYLEGVTVTLKNAEDKIVGTGVTDKDGNFKVAAIEAVKVFAADADLAIGKFTFDENGVLFDNTNNTTPPIVDDQKYAASIFAKETLYSGYYADGAVVKDVKVSYTDSTGAEALATVVDNKYYIVSLTPVTGSVTATATNFYAAGPLDENLKVDAQKVPVYNVANSQNRDYVQIYAPSKIVYGTVITLAAQNEYSTGVPGEDGVIQKYKFAGWYVNGDKVSDELIYAYTVEGDCTIYADYKVSSYVAAPADESNGLSMDVLVLGIVIVVLGLLAFAYAVKFKKE